MKSVSVSDIKQELQNLPPKEVAELCLRLARYKKDNKELLGYLLFESHDREGYTNRIKEDIEEDFKEVNRTSLYQAKKTLRKILRLANKYVRYTANKETEAEVLIYYCTLLKSSGIPIHKNKVLSNLYQQQLKKIKVALETLHEDIQYDYIRQVEKLEQ
jgi:hypothetical protein